MGNSCWGRVYGCIWRWFQKIGEKDGSLENRTEQNTTVETSATYVEVQAAPKTETSEIWERNRNWGTWEVRSRDISANDVDLNWNVNFGKQYLGKQTGG